MSVNDKQIIKKYREWSWTYFVNEFVYENQLFLSLSKARDMIINEQIMGTKVEISGFDLGKKRTLNHFSCED